MHLPEHVGSALPAGGFRGAGGKAAAQRRKRLMIGVLAATVLAALGAYFGLEDERLTGIAILVGGLLFLLVALGALGAGISPRDRDRAGAIDFGNRGDR